MSMGTALPRMCLTVTMERWPRKTPLKITSYTFDAVEMVVVSLASEGLVGRGEAAGVYYKLETPASMLRQIEQVRPAIEAGVSRSELQQLLPPGGARNALDCALWDLEAKFAQQPVWVLAKQRKPQPLRTTFTCGADDPASVVAKALSFSGARSIKLKLSGDLRDAERVRALRAALPHAWLCVDANQGFDPPKLDSLMPVLVDADVKLIEQPYPLDKDALLDGLNSPIPIAADESVRSSAEIPNLVGRFDMINIKLDKCGGLTEALVMADMADRLGLRIMVGSMGGTSLAMGPATIVGQRCEVVDLDGPALLERDREPAVEYIDGRIVCAPGGWGDAGS